MFDMTEICCGNCGICFRIPTGRYEELQRTKETFWCPNGHRRHFKGETFAEELNRLKAKAATERRLRIEAQKRADEYRCPDCVRRFKTGQGLINHAQRVHGRKVDLRALPEKAGPNRYNTKIS